jgi:hypothetical protein
MMDRETVQNMLGSVPKIKFEKLVHLVGCIIRIYHNTRSSEREICLLIFGYSEAIIKAAANSDRCRIKYKKTEFTAVK